MFENLKSAIEDLAKGKFILVYDQDNREAEVDLVALAEKITPAHVYRLRHDAGGLICIAMSMEISETLGLPYMLDIFSKVNNEFSIFSKVAPNVAMPYGDKPAFSITINHVNTYTGITDNDRALTISEFGRLGNEIIHNGSDIKKYQNIFGSNFRAPGHTHLLIAKKGLLSERKGHTELTVSLTFIGNKLLHLNITPCTVLCEMLGEKTGKALTVKKAKEYARKEKLHLVNGQEIIQAFDYIIKEQQ